MSSPTPEELLATYTTTLTTSAQTLSAAIASYNKTLFDLYYEINQLTDAEKASFNTVSKSDVLRLLTTMRNSQRAVDTACRTIPINV